MSKEIRAGGAFIEIYLKEKERLDEKFKSYKARLDAFARGVGMVGGALTAVSGAALTGLGAAFASFTSQGDKLTDTANRLGITTSRLQELTYAAEQSGASMEDVERAMLQAQKKGKDFDKVAAQIAAIEDPVKRNQAAFEAFGKAGPKIAPMLKDLKELSANANRLGLVFKPEDVAMAGQLADMWGAINAQLQAAVFHVGEALGPAMERLFQIMQQVLAVVIRFIDANRVLVVGVAAGAIALGVMAGAFLAVAGAAWIASVAMSTYATVTAIALALTTTLAGPLAIIGALIVANAALLIAAAGAWAFYTESGQAAMKFLWETVTTTLKGIGDAIAAGNMQLAWDVALAGILVVVFKFQEKLIAAWESMKTRILTSTVDMAKQINALLPDFMKIKGIDAVGNALKAQREQAEKKASEDAKSRTGAAEKALKTLADKAEKEKEKAFPGMPPFTQPNIPKFPGVGAGAQSGQFGTFSAAIAAMAGRTGQLTVEQKQLDALEGIGEDIAIIKEKAEEGGLVFA